MGKHELDMVRFVLTVRYLVPASSLPQTKKAPVRLSNEDESPTFMSNLVLHQCLDEACVMVTPV